MALKLSTSLWGISFTNDNVQLHDVFELYTVCASGLFSKDELTDFAFDMAKVYWDSFDAGSDVKPVLSKTGTDVSFVTISGQLYK